MRLCTSLFPSVQYLPDWIPGAGFIQTASEWKAHTNLLAETALVFVKKQMVMSNALPFTFIRMASLHLFIRT